MLLDHYQEIDRVLIGYQFHFGVGTHGDTKILDCMDDHKCSLRDISKECYRTANNRTNKCPRQPDRQVANEDDKDDTFITAYKKNVNRRIRTSYREIRDSLLIKLDSFPISSLTIDGKKVKIQSLELCGIISIQSLGVCTISIWFEGYTPTSELLWRNICDPALITFSLVHINLTRTAWRLVDFTRYLALNCHKTLNPAICFPDGVEHHDILKSERKFESYLKNEYKKIGIEPISYSIESYPFVFIKYNFDSSTLTEVFSKPSCVADARLVINGDLHWKFKNDEIVRNTVNSSDVSTRDTIHWLVTPQGTLKVCSKELDNETSLEESFTTVLLETDMALTMRYFLSSIMQNLSDLAQGISNPIKVSEMKDQIFTSIDKYFNINISQNDLTQKRMKRFLDVFSITETYNSVKDRLEILSVKISNENSSLIEKQQIFLTIIFGLFGSLQVLYPFLKELLKSKHLSELLVFAIAFTIAGIMASLIYLLVRNFKSKGKK